MSRARGPSGGAASGRKLPYGVFTGSAENALEVRLKGDSTALTRFVVTLQNKRLPLRGLTLGRDNEESRLTLLLEGEEESARRYATLLSGLEDVRQVEAAQSIIQVVLVKLTAEASEDVWRKKAQEHGVQVHKSEGTVVASGDPEKVEEWLAALDLAGLVEEAIRLGPAARPGNGGD